MTDGASAEQRAEQLWGADAEKIVDPVEQLLGDGQIVEIYADLLDVAPDFLDALLKVIARQAELVTYMSVIQRIVGTKGMERLTSTTQTLDWLFDESRRARGEVGSLMPILLAHAALSDVSTEEKPMHPTPEPTSPDPREEG